MQGKIHWMDSNGGMHKSGSIYLKVKTRSRLLTQIGGTWEQGSVEMERHIGIWEGERRRQEE